MARILIASGSSDIAVMERLLAQEHETIVATTMAEAVAKLKEEEVDLIMISVYFDESRMFDLMSQCKAIPKNAKTPIISFCTRDTLLMGAMHDTIAVVTKLLGAWTSNCCHAKSPRRGRFVHANRKTSTDKHTNTSLDRSQSIRNDDSGRAKK
jgi:hypothetical protein